MNTRLLPTFLLFALLAMAVPAESGVAFVPDEVDLGTVDENTVTDSVFFVKNTGPHEVVLTRVKPTCGCTEVTVGASTIAPGDSIPLRFSFASLGFSGRTVKKIIVMYEEGDEQRSASFTYRAMVRNALTLTPERSFFRGLDADVTLAVTNMTADTLSITGADYPRRHVVSSSLDDLAGTPVPPHKTIQLPLHVQFTPSVKNVEYTWVRLHTDTDITPHVRHFLHPFRVRVWLIVVVAAVLALIAALTLLLVRKRFPGNRGT